MKKIFCILVCVFLLISQAYAQESQTSAPLQAVVLDLIAKKPTRCDWYAEVKRTNTWFQRDQENREAMGLLHLANKNKNDALFLEKKKKIVEALAITDKILQAELDDLVQRCGWPTTSGFGEKAPTYAVFIIRHADLDYQLKYFPVMKAAVDLGELPARFLASAEDRIRMLQDKPQIYGSQIVDGKNPNEMVLWPIEDEERVDERRASVGMYPVGICTYIRLFTPPVQYNRCK